MNSLAEFLKTLGVGRLAAMAGVAMVMVGFFVFLTMRVTTPSMGLLFSGLDFEDSAAIVARLETLEVPYKLVGDGSTIMVPQDQTLRLRMSLAEDGLPAGGNVGYEIFDNSDALGTTSFVQNINHLRALEGELARTIRAIGPIDNARVHLVLPQKQLFAREQRQPSASIVLKVRGGTLTRNQTQSIQHLVASAVDGLVPARVSIVDERGKLLASGVEENETSAMLSSLEERNAAYENRIRQQIEDIVGSIVGPDNARVQVTAEVDFNRVTQSSEIYDPDGQVVRSTQTVEENSSNVDKERQQGVTVSNSLPEATAADEGDEASSSASSSRLEETVNYEISRTTRTEVLEAGRIKRMSVAVLVDGTYENGQYQPRSDQELEQITALIRSAIGYDETRGDQVEVINLQLAQIDNEIDPVFEDESFLSLSKADYFKIAEMSVLVLMGIMLIIFVVRPLIQRMGFGSAAPAAAGGAGLPAQAAVAGPAGQQMLPTNAEGIPQIAGPDADTQAAIAAQLSGSDNPQLVAPQMAPNLGAMIDIAQVEGRVKESSIKKVGEIVSKHPEEALAIMRNWLHETP